jgi:hypothetical protein
VIEYRHPPAMACAAMTEGWSVVHDADAEDAADFRVAPGTHVETNYVGAVYGSLLAASVVAGTSPQDGAPNLAELCVLLLVTGLVFWAAHVYSRVIGERLVTGGGLATWGQIARIARHEWPLVEAAIAPCVVATGVTLLGGSAVAAAWSALITAIVDQVAWSVRATSRAGASTTVILISAFANLSLGLTLVILKAALTH